MHEKFFKACAELKENLEVNRIEYSKAWEFNSNFYNEQGYYHWMSKFINNCKTVLEIGTGNGYSTLELAKHCKKLISIDRNERCLSLTEEKLRNAGIKSKLLIREVFEPTEIGVDHYFAGIDSVFQDDTVLLIQGDILNDPCLHNWLFEIGNFDAVVCWLAGAPENDILLTLRNTNFKAAQYRSILHKGVFVISNDILKSGGIVHLVDRIICYVDPLLLINDYLELAKGTSIKVQTPDLFKFSDPLEHGIEYSLPIDNKNKYFISTLAYKS